MFGLTLTGWVVALLTARLLRSTIIRGPSTPFVMGASALSPAHNARAGDSYGERTFEYLKKAGTVILAFHHPVGGYGVSAAAAGHAGAFRGRAADHRSEP